MPTPTVRRSAEARPGARAAGEVAPGAWTIATVPDRVRRLGDLSLRLLGPPEPVAPLEELACEVLRTHGGMPLPAPPATPGRG